MSASDNSTVVVLHDVDGPFMYASEYEYTYNDATEISAIASPYAVSKIFSLDVGPSATRFSVHSEMLERSSILPPSALLAPNDQPIALPELDEATAHVLVHYLYSLNYRALKPSFANETAMKYESHRLATCVYCAAVRYNVSGLAQLAKKKMVHTGIDLPIFEILAVARDHGFPLLPESDTVYPEYLETAIVEAMKEDSQPFRRPEFIANFGGNSRLLQVIWKTVMSSFAQGPTVSRTIEDGMYSGTQTPVANSSFAESEMTSEEYEHQLPSSTDSVVKSPHAANTDTRAHSGFEPTPVALETLNTLPKATPMMAEATIRSDGASNDDLGLPAIEPFVEYADVLESLELSETRTPKHVRSDSVLEKTVSSDLKSVDNEKCGSVDEVVPVNSNDNPVAAKKSKKRTKKKQSSILF